MSIRAIKLRHGWVLFYSLFTVVIVLGGFFSFWRRLGVNIKVFISISIILNLYIFRLTVHIGELVTSTVSEALVSDCTKLSDLLIDGIVLHKAGSGH